jgi:hypothetical protein
VSIRSVEEAGTDVYHAPPGRSVTPSPERRIRLRDWGLGVAGDFTYLSAKDKDLVGSTQNWSVTGFGLRLSATFN